MGSCQLRRALSAQDVDGLIALVHVSGLRSFSNPICSLFVGTVIAKDPPLLQALVVPYGLQIGLAFLRQRSDGGQEVVDNEPILLSWPVAKPCTTTSARRR